MAKALIINADLQPVESNPHSWLVLEGSEPGSSPRIMTGTLRRSYRGFEASASAFGRAKVNVAPIGDAPWALTAVRAEVLLPIGADDRYTTPQVLMEETDSLAGQGSDPLLGYVTFTWMPSRLHEQYEEVRRFTAEEIVPLGCPVLMVQHAPHLARYSSPPHCHLCIVPLRLTQLGWAERVTKLTGDRLRPLILSRFDAFRTRRANAPAADATSA